jgi:hypothetical protein
MLRREGRKIKDSEPGLGEFNVGLGTIGGSQKRQVVAFWFLFFLFLFFFSEDSACLRVLMSTCSRSHTVCVCMYMQACA